MMQSFLLITLMSYANPGLLVSTDWVADHIDDPDVRIVDTRTRGYDDGHIPGAVYLELDASRDKDNPPTFVPDLETFAATIESLGISDDTHIIFYDDRSGVYGTRPWVLLRLIGHENASILNGGWTKWVAEGRPTNSEVPEVARGSLEIRLNDQWIATADDVEAAIDKPGVRILDTRARDEYTGSDLQNNPRGGAIPSATHLFWEDTLDGEYQSIKPADELSALFESQGLSPGDQVITYCQGGGRSAHELFVLHLMGYDDLRLYMGSMEDWSRQPERPLVDGK